MLTTTVLLLLIIITIIIILITIIIIIRRNVVQMLGQRHLLRPKQIGPEGWARSRVIQSDLNEEIKTLGATGASPWSQTWLRAKPVQIMWVPPVGPPPAERGWMSQVLCTISSSRKQRSLCPDPWSLQLDVLTWKVTSQVRKGSELVLDSSG